MGLVAPNPGRSIADVFEETIPNYGDSAGKERHVVGPELIVYLQWLIRCAPFKSPDQGARRDEHKKYYDAWVVSFKARRGAYRKKLLKELQIWYHKHPPGMMKGHGRRRSKVPSQASTAVPVDEGFLLESGSDSEVVLRARPRPQARTRSGGLCAQYFRAIVDLNVRSERNSMDSSLVSSAAIASKQAAGRGRKKQAAAVLVNFIVNKSVQ